MWRRIWLQVPDPIALCLMPDHVHLLHRRDVHQELGLAMNAYARWRNHRRGEGGSVWRRQEAPEEVRGSLKERRSVRYIHLNPCRAGLASDPLAWAWSTHRDRVGLAIPSRVRLAPDPIDFHGYVSADPTVHVQGTDLPQPIDLVEPGAAGLDRLREAVSAVTRTVDPGLHRQGPARTLWIRACRVFSVEPTRALAAHLDLATRSVRCVSNRWTAELAVVARAAGDRRFELLVESDRRQDPRWRRYRSMD